MLRQLVIRDVVLIDRLTLDFGEGLGVLTGETGAGKSILLDALGLALGARSETGLVRAGAQQATVSAAFGLVMWALALPLLRASLRLVTAYREPSSRSPTVDRSHGAHSIWFST